MDLKPRPQCSHIRLADGFMISAVSSVAVYLVFMCLFKFFLKLVVYGHVTDLKTGSFFGIGPGIGLTTTGNIIYEKYIMSKIHIDSFTEKYRPYLSYIIMAGALIHASEHAFRLFGMQYNGQ